MSHCKGPSPWLYRVPGEQAGFWLLAPKSLYVAHENLTPGVFLSDVSAWRVAAAAFKI